MDIFHIHIVIILFTLGLHPKGFIFGFFPQKVLYQLIVSHAYVLLNLSILNQCGTS